MIALLAALLMVVSPAGAPNAGHSPFPIQLSSASPSATEPYVLPASWVFLIDKVPLPDVQSIVGLDKDIAQYRSGGDWKPIIVPGRYKTSPITLKRGMVSDNSLFEWRVKVINGQPQSARPNCTIDTQTPMHEPVEIILHRCYVSQYQGHSTAQSRGPETAQLSFDSIEVKLGGH